MAKRGVNHPALLPALAEYVGNIRIAEEYTAMKKSITAWRTDIFSFDDSNSVNLPFLSMKAPFLQNSHVEGLNNKRWQKHLQAV